MVVRPCQRVVGVVGVDNGLTCTAADRASSAAGADLLVPGSRGLGAVAGFLVGSTGPATPRDRHVVAGRRNHRPAPGARTGPVTHAVMHHSTSPVAVVAHD
ncbi:hypothetical protein ACFXA3_21435 [Streptomyces sp. NPDC059456]|uniref:hypothetical protein n=1 Tax=Streptomyces sp. NPDC059456 TaxID=3346838 RepID=UPI003683E38D